MFFRILKRKRTMNLILFIFIVMGTVFFSSSTKNLNILDNVILPSFESRKKKSGRVEKIQYGIELLRRLGIVDVA